MNRINFEEFFKIQSMSLKLSLAHPDMKHDIYWVVKSLLVYGSFTIIFCMLLNTLMIEIKNNNLFSAFRNAVPCTIYFCVMFNYYILIKEQKTLRILINLMKADYENLPKMDVICKNIVHKYTAKSSWIMKNFHILMFLSIWGFIAKSIVLSVYYVIQGDYKFVPYHEMVFIEYVDARKESNVFIFACTYFSGAFFSTVCALIYAVVLPLGAVFMLHACCLLELIIIKFDGIFEKDNVDERLTEIIKNLQYVYRFIVEINNAFKLIYEVMLKQTSYIFPVVCYTIFKSIQRGEYTIEYISLFIGAIVMSTPCYYSDMLMSKGEELRLAIYASGWERVFLPKSRKTLLIILMRALQPTSIRTVFQIMNLDTLADVYRQAYTIFNLMTAMWN